MPMQTYRRRGGFLAGLLAGGSVLVLSGTTLLASELKIDGTRVTVTDTQLADSGESGESGATTATGESGESGTTTATTASGEAGESGESGEGGEGGEAGAFADAEPDVQLTANLLAMKGHLLVGRELFDAGSTDAAAPHFLEPRADYYATVEVLSGEMGELGDELVQVEIASGAGEAGEGGEGGEVGEFGDEWEEAIEAIDYGVEEAVEDSENPMATLLAASLLVLRKASHEFEEATEGGAVSDAEEYEAGRGFYQAVRAEIEANADDLSAINADKYAALVAALDEAGRAWPSAAAPASPPVSAEDLNAAIANFEIAALAFR